MLFNHSVLDSLCREFLADSAMIGVDPNGAIIYWSHEASRIFGYEFEEIRRFGVLKLYSSRNERVLAAIRESTEKGNASFDYWHYRKDGTSFRGEVLLHRLTNSTGETQFGMFVRNLDSEKKLRDWSIQASRLHDLGMLTAATVHEINNPLSFLIANLELMIENLGSKGDRQDLERCTHSALEAAERIKRITLDMKGFARLGTEKLEPALISEAIQYGIDISKPVLRHVCRVEFDGPATHEAPDGLKHDELFALADPSRLSQVLVNLLINAGQAFKDHDVKKNVVRISAGIRDGKVGIEVRDNGPGICPEDAGKLFQPFFSTKESSGGSGLGLFICKSIIASYGGDIQMESSPGQGCTFRITLLPAAPLKSSARNRPRAVTGVEMAVKEDTASATTQSTQRILIVDDDAEVARALATYLRRQYEVEVSNDSAEAIRRLRENSSRINAVFCDLNMPGMDGPQFLERVRTEIPGLEKRIVFMTGGAYSDRMYRFLLEVSNPRIEKPFDPQEIQRAIEKVRPKEE